jgi:diacylglycerol kinase (ATP)
MGHKGKTGLAHFVAAASYSKQGFVAAFKYESAFRQELALAVIGFILARFIAETTTQFLFLVLPLMLLLQTELLNSAGEAVVDRFSSEDHELSGRTKDMGSAAVFVASCIAGLSWIVILYGRFA